MCILIRWRTNDDWLCAHDGERTMNEWWLCARTLHEIQQQQQQQQHTYSNNKAPATYVFHGLLWIETTAKYRIDHKQNAWRNSRCFVSNVYRDCTLVLQMIALQKLARDLSDCNDWLYTLTVRMFMPKKYGYAHSSSERNGVLTNIHTFIYDCTLLSRDWGCEGALKMCGCRWEVWCVMSDESPPFWILKWRDEKGGQ